MHAATYLPVDIIRAVARRCACVKRIYAAALYVRTVRRQRAAALPTYHTPTIAAWTDLLYVAL